MYQQPRKLWTISTSASTPPVGFETVAGITPANPIHLNGFFLHGMANFKIVTKTDYTLGVFIIKGALGPPGAADPGGGFIDDTTGIYDSSLILAEGDWPEGDGFLRPFQINTRNKASAIGDADHNRIACPIIPNFLQLGYTGLVAGGNPHLVVEVWCVFGGPMPQGYC